MKVLAINSSPRKQSGNTALILDPFLEGIKEAGGEVELVFSHDLLINPCRRCTEDSDFESKGKCECDDDMNDLYPKFRDADIWIFAFPNYLNSMNANLKNLLDRMEPLFEVDFEAMLPQKINGEKGKMVCVSTCGFWDMKNFNLILAHMKEISALFDRQFSGSLLRPHSWALNALTELGFSVEHIYDSARRAGRELVNKGHISDEAQEEVSQELVERDSFMNEIKDIKVKN